LGQFWSKNGICSVRTGRVESAPRIAAKRASEWSAKRSSSSGSE